MELSRSFSLGELVAGCGAQVLTLIGDPTTCITGIAYDVRSVDSGDLFAALPRADFRGHEFAQAAIDQGAVALLVETALELDVPQLVVADTLLALPLVADLFYGHPSREINVIGVTGTDGKTTTTTLIDAILRAAGEVTGFISTVSVRVGPDVQLNPMHLTTPESPDLQRFLRTVVEAGATWVVLESSSQGLDLHRLDQIPFHIGVITNITPEHLYYHETLEAYKRAKGTLFDRVAAVGGVAVVNIDDDGAIEMLNYVGNSRVIRCSVRGQPADVRAGSIELGDRDTHFDLITPGNIWTPIHLPLPGRFNVANALCAVGAALAADIPIEAIKRGLEMPIAITGRMTHIDQGQPFPVIVDFAHTPAALERVLEHLQEVHPHGRRIVLIGGSGALRASKLPALGDVAERLADHAVFTTDNPHDDDPDYLVSQLAIGAEAAGGRLGETFSRVIDRKEAIRHALSMARSGDCVLLAGMGHETNIYWADLVIPWDEAAVAREILAELGYHDDLADLTEQHVRPRSTHSLAVIEPSTPTEPDPTTVRSLTIADVFHPAPVSVVTHTATSNIRTVVALGDIELGSIQAAIIDQQGDRSFPSREIADLLDQSDLTIATGEGLVSHDLLPTIASALNGASIDVITANTEDDAIERVDEGFAEAGLSYARTDRLVVHEVRGLRIGILAFNGIGQHVDRAKLTGRIAGGRGVVDLLLVTCRWGKRRVGIPEADPEFAPDDPREIAHLAIDHGADLVIGSHPGCVQGIEFYREKLITYSHGNFITDDLDDPKSRQGVIGRYHFSCQTLIRVDFLPIIIDDGIQPRLATATEAASVIRRMEGASIILDLGI